MIPKGLMFLLMLQMTWSSALLLNYENKKDFLQISYDFLFVWILCYFLEGSTGLFKTCDSKYLQSYWMNFFPLCSWPLL